MMKNHYAERDVMELDELGNHYSNHFHAMTAENLHNKMDIAAELGWRDAENEALQDEVERLREGDKQADFTRMNLLIEKKIQIEKLEKERDQLKAQVNALTSAISVSGVYKTNEGLCDLMYETPAHCLAVHDAEVIERVLELIGYPCTRHKDFGVDYTKGFNSACEMISQQAKQLRQQNTKEN